MLDYFMYKIILCIIIVINYENFILEHKYNDPIMLSYYYVILFIFENFIFTNYIISFSLDI